MTKPLTFREQRRMAGLRAMDAFVRTEAEWAELLDLAARYEEAGLAEGNGRFTHAEYDRFQHIKEHYERSDGQDVLFLIRLLDRLLVARKEP